MSTKKVKKVVDVNNVLIGELVNSINNYHGDDTETLIKLTERIVECNSNEIRKLCDALGHSDIEMLICSFDNFDTFKFYIDERVKKCTKCTFDWCKIVRYITKNHKSKLLRNILFNYVEKYPKIFHYSVIFSVIFRNKNTCADIKLYYENMTDSIYEKLLSDTNIDTQGNLSSNDFDMGIGRWYEYFESIFDVNSDTCEKYGEIMIFSHLLILEKICEYDLSIIIDNYSKMLRNDVSEVIVYNLHHLLQACFDCRIYDNNFTMYDEILMNIYDNEKLDMLDKFCDIIIKFHDTQDKKINLLIYYVRNIDMNSKMDEIFYRHITILLREMLITMDIIHILEYAKYNEFITQMKKCNTVSLTVSDVYNYIHKTSYKLMT